MGGVRVAHGVTQVVYHNLSYLSCLAGSNTLAPQQVKQLPEMFVGLIDYPYELDSPPSRKLVNAPCYTTNKPDVIFEFWPPKTGLYSLRLLQATEEDVVTVVHCHGGVIYSSGYYNNRPEYQNACAGGWNSKVLAVLFGDLPVPYYVSVTYQPRVRGLNPFEIVLMEELDIVRDVDVFSYAQSNNTNPPTISTTAPIPAGGIAGIVTASVFVFGLALWCFMVSKLNRRLTSSKSLPARGQSEEPSDSEAFASPHHVNGTEAAQSVVFPALRRENVSIPIAQVVTQAAVPQASRASHDISVDPPLAREADSVPMAELAPQEESQPNRMVRAPQMMTLAERQRLRDFLCALLDRFGIEFYGRLEQARLRHYLCTGPPRSVTELSPDPHIELLLLDLAVRGYLKPESFGPRLRKDIFLSLAYILNGDGDSL